MVKFILNLFGWRPVRRKPGEITNEFRAFLQEHSKETPGTIKVPLGSPSWYKKLFILYVRKTGLFPFERGDDNAE